METITKARFEINKQNELAYRDFIDHNYIPSKIK
jgi:hypothetical protein